jgi:hypothetical protein
MKRRSAKYECSVPIIALLQNECARDDVRRCEDSRDGAQTKKEDIFGGDDRAGDGTRTGRIPEAVACCASQNEEGREAQADAGEVAGRRVEE